MLVDSHIDTETIGVEEEYQVPNLTESVSVDENGVLHITVTNLSLTEDYEIDTTILEKNISEVKGGDVQRKTCLPPSLSAGTERKKSAAMQQGGADRSVHKKERDKARSGPLH